MPAESLPMTAAPTGPSAAGWVVVHPRWRRRLVRWGLITAADYLNLPGDVVSGHANRHVARVVLGSGRRRVLTFLKREHRVPWRERLRSTFAGFGWASKSEREARTLRQLRRAGIPAPRCLAFGEDGAGRAFLLIQATSGAEDLRRYLIENGSPIVCRELGRRLGETLARVHAAGFDCPDLASKHVLVRPRDLSLVLIDWQRAVRLRRVRWAVRVRELAALNATVADELASLRERLACLRAYLQAAIGGSPDLRPWVDVIRRQSDRLLRRRSLRDQRRPPLAGSAQLLRWVDGERLVLARPAWRACRRVVPAWLAGAACTTVPAIRQTEHSWCGRRVVLRKFPRTNRLRRFLNWLLGRNEVAAGPRLAGRCFHRQRCGEIAPRPLAFGQQPGGGSFIVFDPADVDC